MISAIRGYKMNSDELPACHVSDQTVRNSLQEGRNELPGRASLNTMYSLFSGLFLSPPFHFNCKCRGLLPRH